MNTKWYVIEPNTEYEETDCPLVAIRDGVFLLVGSRGGTQTHDLAVITLHSDWDDGYLKLEDIDKSKD
jgi:hypothetical protein